MSSASRPDACCAQKRDPSPMHHHSRGRRAASSRFNAVKPHYTSLPKQVFTRAFAVRSVERRSAHIASESKEPYSDSSAESDAQQDHAQSATSTSQLALRASHDRATPGSILGSRPTSESDIGSDSDSDTDCDIAPGLMRGLRLSPRRRADTDTDSDSDSGTVRRVANPGLHLDFASGTAANTGVHLDLTRPSALAWRLVVDVGQAAQAPAGAPAAASRTFAERPGVRVTDNARCCLHRFMRLLLLDASCVDWSAIDADEPVAWDAQALRHCFLGYPVCFALFLLQNAACMGHLRLWHVVQHGQLRAPFLRLVAIVQRRLRYPAARAVEWRALCAWFLAQTQIGPLLHAAHFSSAAPLAAPRRTFEQGRHAEEEAARAGLFRLVRSALRHCGTPAASHDDLCELYEEVLGELGHAFGPPASDQLQALGAQRLERLLAAKQHSRVKMAQLLALDWRLLHAQASAGLWLAERAACVEWLRSFAAHGCACAN